MLHISLPPGLPGIIAGFTFLRKTARPMREFAETLLQGLSTRTSSERKTAATYVFTLTLWHAWTLGIPSGNHQAARG